MIERANDRDEGSKARPPLKWSGVLVEGSSPLRAVDRKIINKLEKALSEGSVADLLEDSDIKNMTYPMWKSKKAMQRRVNITLGVQMRQKGSTLGGGVFSFSATGVSSTDVEVLPSSCVDIGECMLIGTYPR